MENQLWVNPDRNNLILQTRFGRTYGQRLARFYRRTSNIIRFVQIFSGSAAFGVVLAQIDSTALIAWAGLIMAAASAIDLVWQPGDLASQCARGAEQWGQLEAKAYSIKDDDLRKEIAMLQSLVLPSWECMRAPVFNDLMKEINSKQREPVGFRGRFFAKLM